VPESNPQFGLFHPTTKSGQFISYKTGQIYLLSTLKSIKDSYLNSDIALILTDSSNHNWRELFGRYIFGTKETG